MIAFAFGIGAVGLFVYFLSSGWWPALLIAILSATGVAVTSKRCTECWWRRATIRTRPSLDHPLGVRLCDKHAITRHDVSHKGFRLTD